MAASITISQWLGFGKAPPLGTNGSLGPWNDGYKDYWMMTAH